jgi:hypothetical protein
MMLNALGNVCERELYRLFANWWRLNQSRDNKCVNARRAARRYVCQARSISVLWRSRNSGWVTTTGVGVREGLTRTTSFSKVSDE